MKVQTTKLPGVLIIEPVVYRDSRGFFIETYHAERYTQHGLPAVFVQDNHSRSTRGTLRGLHLQLKQPQGKLVRAIQGSIFDVAVDIRVDSPWFGQWIGVELSGDDHRQLYVPPGFAHGFCVISEHADVSYKCTDYYSPGDDITLAWDDPDIAIQWPITTPLLSHKDANGLQLKNALSRLPIYKT